MVVRTRFAAIVIPLLFYVFSGAVGGFFVWHAFHGERGIAADLETRREMAEVEAKLKVIRAEKADWQRRVDLLRGPVIDRDLLDEEARNLLNRVNKTDLVVILPQDKGQTVRTKAIKPLALKPPSRFFVRLRASLPRERPAIPDRTRRVAKPGAGGSMAAASIAPPEGGNPRLAAFVGEGDAISIYRAMLLIRRFEEKAGQLFGMGLIGGFCHLYIGQEAVVVGMRLAARETDQFIASYRHHGHLLACGVDPRAVMAEMTGRRGGVSGGKGGSMHMFAPDCDYFGGHGIVGAQASLGTGLAFANAYRGDGRVCICFFGDGAADQGQVAESFNMAAHWRLPIVFVIENNRAQPAGARRRAGQSRPARRRFRHSRRIDRRHVRRGGARGGRAGRSRGRAPAAGPAILEMRTERYRGHSLADPAKYRRKDEARAAQAPDPVERAREKILRAGLADEADLKRLDAEVRAIVVEAAEYAAQSPEPDAAELEKDVLL